MFSVRANIKGRWKGNDIKMLILGILCPTIGHLSGMNHSDYNGKTDAQKIVGEERNGLT